MECRKITEIKNSKPMDLKRDKDIKDYTAEEIAKARRERILDLPVGTAGEMLATLYSVIEAVKNKNIDVINELDNKTDKTFNNIGDMVAFEVSRADLMGGVQAIEYIQELFDKYIVKHNEEQRKARIRTKLKDIKLK